MPAKLKYVKIGFSIEDEAKKDEILEIRVSIAMY